MPARRTVNERILRESIRHHAGVQRYGTSVANSIIDLLNRSDAELVAAIRERLDALGPVEDQIFGKGKDTTEKLEALLKEVRALNKQAYDAVRHGLTAEDGELIEGLPDRLKELARREAGHGARAGFAETMIADALPVRLTFTRPDLGLLKAIVDSQPFKGRLLSKAIDKLEGDRARALEETLQNGLAQGENTEQLVRRIVGTKSRKGVLQMHRHEARTIARTYTNHVSNAARSAFYHENDDIIKGELWIATLDTRTCEECAKLNGKTWKLGERKQSLPAHFNCRCTVVPVLRSWQEMGIDLREFDNGTRQSMGGDVPALMSYNEWLREQDARTQDEVLGKRRGAWFRKYPDKHFTAAWAMNFQVRNDAPLSLDDLT
jgi:SPP1 gp7 family putative phage head morphogenesis protein